MDIAVPASEPSAWFLAFFERTSLGWLNRLPLFHFRHVSAFGYCPGLNVWIFYDVHRHGTSIRNVSHETARAGIAEWTAGAVVVRMPASRPAPRRFRLGFTCVSAMAHLVGAPCVALTPDRLYLACLRHGGEVVLKGPRLGCESAATAAGPDAADAGAAGAG
jgi:hypothetical protein